MQDFFVFVILDLMKSCLILIDGSNFYFKLKDLELHHLLCFGFSSFAQKLANKTRVVKVIYYIGKIRQDGTEKTQKLFDNQQKLLAHLKKQKIRYSLGYLLKTNDKFHEKGVDVNIAVDMLVATYENLCDRIILVSSDTVPVTSAHFNSVIEAPPLYHKPTFPIIVEETVVSEIVAAPRTAKLAAVPRSILAVTAETFRGSMKTNCMETMSSNAINFLVLFKIFIKYLSFNVICQTILL